MFVMTTSTIPDGIRATPMLMLIPPSRFRSVPWDDNSVLARGLRQADGSRWRFAPSDFKRVIAKAAGHRFSPSIGVEFEWFNFRETPESLHEAGFKSPKPLTPGMFGYSLIRAAQNRDYFVALMEELRTSVFRSRVCILRLDLVYSKQPSYIQMR